MEPNELKHYGVKGMKWGVRRTQEQLDRASGRKSQRAERRENVKSAIQRYRKPQNSSEYASSGRQTVDRLVWGKRAARRFGENLDKGQSLRKSKAKTVVRNTAITSAVVLGTSYANQAMRTGSMTLGINQLLKTADANVRMAERRGQDFAHKFADTKGLPSMSTIEAMFDSASGTYRVK